MSDRFSVDKRNRLLLANGGRRNSVSGSWSLDADHNLVFTAQKRGKPAEPNQVIVFNAQLISAGERLIVFSTSFEDKNGLLHQRLIKLSGNWSSDGLNRLVFLVEKNQSPDRLIFQGSWEIDRFNRLTYRYQKTSLKRKEKKEYSFCLEGYWQLGGDRKLLYTLCGGSGRMEFTVCLQSLNLYPEKGKIKYRIGIGAGAKGPLYTRTIVLNGEWKPGRLGFAVFVVKYSGGRLSGVEFGLGTGIFSRGKLAFSLNYGPLPSAKLIFTRSALKQDNEWFLSLRKSHPELAVEAGWRGKF